MWILTLRGILSLSFLKLCWFWLKWRCSGWNLMCVAPPSILKSSPAARCARCLGLDFSLEWCVLLSLFVHHLPHHLKQAWPARAGPCFQLRVFRDFSPMCLRTWPRKYMAKYFPKKSLHYLAHPKSWQHGETYSSSLQKVVFDPNLFSALYWQGKLKITLFLEWRRARIIPVLLLVTRLTELWL